MDLAGYAITTAITKNGVTGNPPATTETNQRDSIATFQTEVGVF
jgi:hypothetical protein